MSDGGPAEDENGVRLCRRGQLDCRGAPACAPSAG
jgi:hypothetical protein